MQCGHHASMESRCIARGQADVQKQCVYHHRFCLVQLCLEAIALHWKQCAALLGTLKAIVLHFRMASACADANQLFWLVQNGVGAMALPPPCYFWGKLAVLVSQGWNPGPTELNGSFAVDSRGARILRHTFKGVLQLCLTPRQGPNSWPPICMS